jgi:four helix bundle protein
MRGSSGSIMDNIAEGFERSGRNEFINSLSISKGEIGELKSQLYRAFDNSYIGAPTFHELYAEADLLTKKTTNFITYLNGSNFKGQKFKNRDQK